jgi:hypothetical protein
VTGAISEAGAVMTPGPQPELRYSTHRDERRGLMRLRLHHRLSREEVDLAQPGGLAGQALALQEADKVDVIVRSRRIYVLHDAACTCRDAASTGGLNCRKQLDVLALHQAGASGNPPMGERSTPFRIALPRDWTELRFRSDRKTWGRTNGAGGVCGYAR